MLWHTKGNALDVAIQLNANFGHGCNCFCKMGLGIAKEVKRRLPALYEADQATKRGDRQKLGSFSCCDFEWGIGYNLYTQYTYSHHETSVQLRSLGFALDSALQHGLEANGQPLVIPYIGMGAAKGPEAEIIKLMTEIATPGLDLVLVEFDKRISKALDPEPYHSYRRT